jgi:integrase
MMLVAWLGLRSSEVARLELGDVDRRAGELAVRGKGRRRLGDDTVLTHLIAGLIDQAAAKARDADSPPFP